MIEVWGYWILRDIFLKYEDMTRIVEHGGVNKNVREYRKAHASVNIFENSMGEIEILNTRGHAIKLLKIAGLDSKAA